ncbi:hypothetical protein SAMN06269173_103451 [Hymenobacter mucosus]|uniref:Uncharacterized protein n=2 Tax=Hymenobacter mucosus TaxID=1411120 RepID=A0A238X456_9BACT|nr:hypothetical protein SAMN06269173_103451 [Hymenobacter mucosus]
MGYFLITALLITVRQVVSRLRYYSLTHLSIFPMKSIFKSLLVAAAVTFSVASCTQEGKENADAAATNAEAAAEHTGDAAEAEVNNAGEAIENSAEKAADKTEAAADEAAAETKAAASNAAAATEEAAGDAKAEINAAEKN